MTTTSPAGSGPAGGLHLFTAGVISGHKATIALEELGLPYTLHKVDVLGGEQRSSKFLELNPAGLVPVLVDYDVPGAGEQGFRLPESGAILYYLAAAKDPAPHRLLPADPAASAEVLSWLFFNTGHLSPAAAVVDRKLEFGLPYSDEAMQTATDGLHSTFKLMNGRLKLTGGWLAAGQYTIADVAAISSVLCCSRLLGIDLKTQYPSLAAWLDRVLARPAVIQGLNTPDRNRYLDQDGGGSNGAGM